MGAEEVAALTRAAKDAASANVPFSDAELASALASLQQLAEPEAKIDWDALRALYAETAHTSHKQWPDTESAAARLEEILGGPECSSFRALLERVLGGGGWNIAVAAASVRPPTGKPWVVLVTGLNGIRKTTAIYQEWFPKLLSEGWARFDASELPCGANSFFRQLDFIIATVANEEFRVLYEIDDIIQYAARKDAIFARYRKIAEMFGALLVKAARRQGLNLMVETSGRDVGMYTYIDHFFPDDAYNKLVVNFSINDIAFAEASVDARMGREMAAGHAALGAGVTDRSSRLNMININAGGPYGSGALRKVLDDSTAVWERIQAGYDAAQSWHKASIQIHARDDGKWTASVRREKGGSSPNIYTFEAPQA